MPIAAYGFLIMILFFIFSGSVLAVPPPDFIIQAVSQLASFFVIGTALLSGIFASSYQYLRAKAGSHKIIFWTLSIGSILLIAGVSAYSYDQYQMGVQQREYTEKWLQESSLHDEKPPEYHEEPILATGSIDAPGGSVIDIEDTPSVSTGVTIPDAPLDTSIVSNTSGSVVDLANTDTGTKNNTTEIHNTPIILPNSEFDSILKNQDPHTYTILDAREDLEYRLGRVPASTHIRFADLRDGYWKQLDKNQDIYVLCWSGMRGSEVAAYLRELGYRARFLEHGVNGWVEYGGIWEGKVTLKDTYTTPNMTKLYTTAEVKSELQSGVILIDSRDPSRVKKHPIKNAILIPLMYTPSNKKESVFAQVPIGSTVITICDTYINCFDAKITGIELEEKYGAHFLGRYNKPWEY